MSISDARAREIIVKRLNRLSSSPVVESFLVNHNKYCGHVFRSGAITVRWMIGQPFAEILGNQGTVQRLDLSDDESAQAA